MINYETLLSSYDDKLTLLQWLKKVEAALKGASAVSFKVNKRGDATLTFSVLFEDGSELETSPIILQQGESVQGATIRNGHLILTLTNGNELDAGNVKPVTSFIINERQHLIVNYGDGTSQDLGTLADFSNADFVAKTLKQTNANFSQAFNLATSSGLTITNVYNRCEVVNNILYLIANIKIKNTSGAIKKIGGAWADAAFIAFNLPTEIAEKIYDIDGVSAHEVGVNGKLVTSTHVTCCSGTISTGSITTYNNFRFDFTNRNIENGVACYFRSSEIVELAIDEELVLMARVSISLF